MCSRDAFSYAYTIFTLPYALVIENPIDNITDKIIYAIYLYNIFRCLKNYWENRKNDWKTSH